MSPLAPRVNSTLRKLTGLEVRRVKTAPEGPVPARAAKTAASGAKPGKLPVNKKVGAGKATKNKPAGSGPAKTSKPAKTRAQTAVTMRNRGAARPAVPVEDLKRQIAIANDPATQARIAAIIGPSLRPTIITGTPHSGAAQLRTALAEHPDVFAPDDLAFTAMKVTVFADGKRSLLRRRLGPRELTGLLWDHVLRDQYARSGREVAVLTDNGEGFTYNWRRLKEVWPGAQWIHVIRDPVEVMDSLAAAGQHGLPASPVKIGKTLDHSMDARLQLPGLTLRYEEFRDSLADSFAAVFSHLGVTPEPKVVEAFTLPETAPKTTDTAKLPPMIERVRRSWGYSS